MKIYKFKDFLELPYGTVYVPLDHEDRYFDLNKMLHIKGKSIKSTNIDKKGEFIDFFFKSLVDIESENFIDMTEKQELLSVGGEVELDTDCGQRDGMFDANNLYLVFTDQEIDRLMKSLEDRKVYE